MKSIMLDLETLGTRPGSIILSIGAVAFDRFAGANDAPLGAEFYTTINIGKADQLGMSRDPDTLKWWTNQSAEARLVFAECELFGVTPSRACSLFNEFVDTVAGGEGCSPQDIEVWGNGSMFDNNLLRKMYAMTGVEPVWSWWNDMCFRTLKRVAAAEVTQSIPRVGTFHNALDDAKTQALWAVAMIQALRTP